MATADLDDGEHLLCDLAEPLQQLLTAHVPHGHRLSTARPLLVLTLPSAQVAVAGDALAAFVALARFSRRLYGSPECKTRFWLRVFASPLMERTWAQQQHWETEDAPPRRAGIARWMLGAREFPRFRVRLVLRIGADTVDISELQRAFRECEVGGASEPEIGRILVSVEVEWANAEVDKELAAAKLVNALRSLFARNAGGRSVFELHSVRYKAEVPYAVQLAIQNELLKDENREFEIRKFYLVAGSSVIPRREDVESLDTLIAATFKQLPRADSPVPSLQNARFDSTLGVSHFAAICSAVRYGCSLKKLTLVCTMTSLSVEERQQCWRWIAFGFFYHRASSQASSYEFALRTLVLNQPQLGASEAQAFEETLRNPVELVFQGASKLPKASKRAKICRVAPGVVINEEPRQDAVQLETLGEERSLEVLSEQDEWLCVVVPCFGLGWINAADVTASFTDEYTDKDRRYDLRLVSASSWCAAPQALRSFFRSAGSQLRSLSVSDSKFAKEHAQMIHAIAKACVHLDHLTLRNCTFAAAVLTALLKALQGELGLRLVSLNLNQMTCQHTSLALESLTEILTHAENLPMLQELRLDMRPLTVTALRNLDAALRASTNLEFLELQDRYPFEIDKVFDRLRKEFGADHQGRVLGVKSGLSSRERAAFLSVIRVDSSSSSSARSSVDAEVLATILKFAGDVVRLRIAWQNRLGPSYGF